MSIDADILTMIAATPILIALLLFGRDALSSRRTIWRHVRRARRNGA